MLNHSNILFLCVYDLECIYNIYPGGGKKNKQNPQTNQQQQTHRKTPQKTQNNKTPSKDRSVSYLISVKILF